MYSISSKNGLAYIDEEQAKNLKNVEVYPGDVLLNITGDSIARCCSIPDEILPARVNQHVSIIRCNDEIDPGYIKYYLINLKPYLLKICGVGGTRNALTKEVIQNLPVRIVDKQAEVAKILSTFDQKIELNNRINQELEALAKLIYDYWFVQFDFPDAQGRPYKSSGGKMVYDEVLKREIPEGWEVKNILSCADLIGGGTPSKKVSEYWGGEIPFFTPTDAGDQVFTLKTLLQTNDLGINGSSTKLFPKGTVFITARGTVGRINLAGVPMAMNQSCYALAPKEGFSPSFMYFHTGQIVKLLKAKSSGSIFKAIVTNDFKFSPSIIPAVSIVSEFTEISQPIFKKILLNQKENQQLAELRDWLLPMLMNGQVRVG